MLDKQIMVISVMDKDRPGIVAEMTEGISALGGNLADLRESVLCGYFTMILVAGFPQDVSAVKVEQALSKGTSSRVSVELASGAMPTVQDPEYVYMLTAVALDRVGLVAQVSRFCCEHSVNILDLASHVDGEQYTMMVQIDLSNIVSQEAFKAEVAAFGKETGLTLVLQHNDIFRATNEI